MVNITDGLRFTGYSRNYESLLATWQDKVKWFIYVFLDSVSLCNLSWLWTHDMPACFNLQSARIRCVPPCLPSKTDCLFSLTLNQQYTTWFFQEERNFSKLRIPKKLGCEGYCSQALSNIQNSDTCYFLRAVQFKRPPCLRSTHKCQLLCRWYEKADFMTSHQGLKRHIFTI